MVVKLVAIVMVATIVMVLANHHAVHASDEDATLADAIVWIRGNRTDVDVSIAAVTDRVTNVETSVSTLDNAFQPVKSAVESVVTDVESLTDRVGIVDDRVDAAFVDIEAVRNTTTDVASWLKTNRTDIDTAITTVDTRVTTLDSAFQPVKSAVESVVTDVESLATRVGGVSDRVDTVTTSVTDVTASVDALRAATQAAIAVLKSNVTEVADKLTTYKDQSQAEITDLQTATVHLGQRIDAMVGFNDSTIIAEVNTLRDWALVTNSTVRQLSAHVAVTDTKIDNTDAKILTLQTIIREVNQTNVELRQLTASLIGQLAELKASIKTQCLTPKVSVSNDRRLLASSDDICDSSSSDAAMSGTTIAIIIISVVGVGAIAAIVMFCVRRRNRKMQPLLGEDELHSFEPSINTRDNY